MNVNDIKSVAVIGAGDMGHGIAETALLVGYPVHLYDIEEPFLEKGVTRIGESVDKLASKGKVPTELVGKIKGELLEPTLDLAEATRDADLIIEVVPEIMDLKKQIFAQVDELAPDHALLASNTSTMSITEIASATGRPEKVLGLHYFNPAVLMRLVEVIRADGTSDETIQIGLDFVKKLRKVPVLVRKDTPGFIANRVNAAPGVLISEIIERDEIEPEALDAFMRMMGARMGPCELTDYIGIDVTVNVGNYFAETLGHDYAPAPHLVKMVEASNLGKKTGQGYFDWSEGRPNIDLCKATRKFSPLTMIFVQINEATKLVEQGVCSVNDVDIALINSSGNPMGPMTLGRQFSKFDLADQLNFLADKYEKEMFRPTLRLLEGGYKH